VTTENCNLFARFDEVFERYCDKVALTTTGGLDVRYADLQRESARVASALTELGCVPGDRISVQVHKSPQAVSLYLGCLRAGLVFHPLNTGYKVHELDYFLGNAEPRVVVCDQGDVATMEGLVASKGIPFLLTLNADGSGSLSDHTREADEHFLTVFRKPDDLASLLYSSGTTGVPKGIMLTHRNLLANGLTLTGFWGFSDSDVLLHALPIFHVHGLFVALGCVFLSGGSMQWLPGFDTDAVLDALPRSTCMMGVPTYYTRLLASDRFTGELVRNVRLFISGSAPLLEETFSAFEARTGQRILERYGMSETGMNTSNPLDGDRKAGTVGPALPGVQVRIVDDNQNVVSAGEIGNIQVRGPNVFAGYWKLPEKTAEDFTADGFFDTGDKGRLDADGYVSIVGRARDMVITGGLNVYPKELERIIDDLPGVRESAVIGAPDPDFGEAVVAVVVPVNGASLEEAVIISMLKEKIAGFKVPKRVVIIAELPRNTMGKVQKNVLREQYSGLT